MLSYRNRMHTMAFALVVVCMFGASSMLAAQQQQATGVPQSSSAAEDARKSIIDATAAAQDVGTGRWFVYGIVSLPYLMVGGPLIAGYQAGKSEVDIPTELVLRIAQKDPAYQLAFVETFKSEVRSKRRKSVYKGFVTGIPIFVGFAVASMNSGQH